MARERQFPFEHELKKSILYYPEKPKSYAGDILEIGPGRGDLLLELAQKKPGKKFIAIEIGKKRFYKMIPRIEKMKTNNILLIQGDARLVLPQYFKDNIFEKILILFPDPWPKERHVFRRLLTLEFLWLLTHQLKNKGDLIFSSDDRNYAFHVQSILDQIHTLKNTLQPKKYTNSLPDLTETFFERKWKDMGRELFFFKYQKEESALTKLQTTGH